MRRSIRSVLGAAAFIMAALISLARVIIGYHDVYDVVGGLVIGLGSAALVLYFISPFLF